MLNKVEVITDQGVLMTLPLEDVSQGYSVQGIDGLDPVKATLVSSSFAQMDGEQYQSSRRDKRNIILTLGYEPDFVNSTVQTLRKRLYGTFMPKSRVLLRFYQDGEPTVQIYGRVESFDSPKFTPEPTAVISILCFDPDFYDPIQANISGSTVANNVEFNHSYPGTVETGIQFKIFINRPLSEFTIYHRPSSDVTRSLVFSSATPLAINDTVTISTVPGNKFVTLNKGGIQSSALFAVSPQSNWISLAPGDNALRIYSAGAAVPYAITYTTKYGGL